MFYKIYKQILFITDPYLIFSFFKKKFLRTKDIPINNDNMSFYNTLRELRIIPLKLILFMINDLLVPKRPNPIGKS